MGDKPYISDPAVRERVEGLEALIEDLQTRLAALEDSKPAAKKNSDKAGTEGP